MKDLMDSELLQAQQQAAENTAAILNNIAAVANETQRWINDTALPAHDYDSARHEAGKIVAAAASAEKLIEQTKAGATRPLTALLTAIRKVWKPADATVETLRTQANALFRQITDHHAAWARQQEDEARKKVAALQAQQAAAVRAQEKALADRSMGVTGASGALLNATEQGEALHAEVVATLLAIPDPAPTAVRSAEIGGLVSTHTSLGFEVVDIVALVTAYPEAVEVKRKFVLDLLRGGAEVPGVKRTETTAVTFRAAKQKEG